MNDELFTKDELEAELGVMECEDCGEEYDECECGTDPDEYPEPDPDVDYLGAYNPLEDTDWSY